MTSEVVGGVVILFVISLTVGMLFVYAQPVLFKGKDSLLERDAYFSILDVNEKINQVRFGMEPSATMKVHLTDYSVTFRNEPIITVNGTSYNVSSIVFYGDNWEIAMENGAIVGRWGSNTEMLSAPPVYLNGKTLTMPVISFNGSVSAGGEGYVILTISQENVTILKTGPADIRIKSSNYQIWRDFFMDLGLSPSVSGDEVRVVVEDSYIVLYRVKIE